MVKYARNTLLVIGGYFLVVVLVLGNSLVPAEGTMIFGDDIYRQFYFFNQYLARSLGKGVIPWWNPYMFSGAPFLANPLTNAFYPINWLFLALPANVVYPIVIAIHLLLAMGGMYLLVSSVLGERSRWAAWAAGASFGLSGFFSSRIFAGQIDILSSAAYLPLVFFLFYRAMERPNARGTIVCGCVFGLQLLAGYQPMGLFTMIGVSILALVLSIQKRRPYPLLIVGVGTLIGLGMAAVALVPIQQLVRAGSRTFEKPYSWSAYGSLMPQELIQLVSPFASGDQYTYWGGLPNYWEHALFIGRIGLAAAIFGVISAFLLRKTNVLLVSALMIALFGVWVSLGVYAPFDLQKMLWEILPFYRFIRIPPHHLLLATFGLSLLAGIGLSRIRHKWLQGLLAVSLVIEMVVYARHFIVMKEMPEQRHDQELIGILRQDKTLFRWLPNFGAWLAPRDSLDFDSGILYHLYSATGYDPTMLRNYYEFIAATIGVVTPGTLEQDVQIPYLNISSDYVNFLNIKYLLVPHEGDPLGGISTSRYTLLREDSIRDYGLYENKQVMPRFFFVRSIVLEPNRGAVAAAIQEGSADLTKSVLVDQASFKPSVSPRPDCIAGDKPQVSVGSYDVNSISLQTTSTCNGFLVSSEVYYPGWEAYIDGKKSYLFEGNLAFRTLYVPKGVHTIVYRYQPTVFVIGGFITLMTAIGSVYWLRKVV